MFITERGSNRYLFLSGITPFEIELVPNKEGTETDIYFRNTTEFSDNETRQRFGTYRTEQTAKKALGSFMQAFCEKRRTFVFEKEV